MDTHDINNTTYDNSTVWSVFAYLGPLVLASLICARKDDMVTKFHIKQGLVLFFTEIALWVVAVILEMFFWPFGFLWPLLQLFHLAILVLAIIGIINVVQKKQKELPVIGHWARNFHV